MPKIHLETCIAASSQQCFDLARSVEIHQQSTASSRERAVAGVTAGLLALGDSVTWQARHFGLQMRLTSRITEFDPPRRFVDEMVKGPFHRLRHIHEFEDLGASQTLMIDDFDYTSPLGLLGRFADALIMRSYMERLLRQRNAFIKQTAERPR